MTGQCFWYHFVKRVLVFTVYQLSRFPDQWPQLVLPFRFIRDSSETATQDWCKKYGLSAWPFRVLSVVVGPLGTNEREDGNFLLILFFVTDLLQQVDWYVDIMQEVTFKAMKDVSEVERGLEPAITRHDGMTELITLQILNPNQSPHRSIGRLEIISAGWNICNSWSGIAATLAIGITQGGTVTVLYGTFVILLMVGGSTATLAELASVYPTAGGQYHWTSILAPKSISRGVSYICGSINIFGWIAITASVAIIPAQLIMAIVIFLTHDFKAHPWHYFLVYQSLNILVLLNNIFLLRKTPWIHKIGFIISICSFVAIVVSCLAMSTEKQTSKFVWTTFINESGWNSDGVVFMTGLITPNYMFAGIDGAIHLAEECSNAAVAVPRALMSTIGIGFVSAFIFAVSMLYSMKDFDAVLGTTTGVPIYEIWYQATSSSAAATVFICCLLIAAFFALNGCQQTASRLTWSFARDKGIFLSHHLGTVHQSLYVPVWALLFNAFVVFIIGCIYLGSTTAFNALIGSGLLLQQLTFAIPAGLLLYRKRSEKFLPASRKFNLGAFGWVTNFATVAFAILVLIFYDFPPVVPVTGRNMNYTSAVIGCMGIFSLLNWVFYARHVYNGPRIVQEQTY